MSKFKITGNKGFWLTFANGYTVSVQFGYGNYCSNYDKTNFEDSETAEVAIWNAAGNWVKHPDHPADDVIGYQTTTQVLLIMGWAESQP